MIHQIKAHIDPKYLLFISSLLSHWMLINHSFISLCQTKCNTFLCVLFASRFFLLSLFHLTHPKTSYSTLCNSRLILLNQGNSSLLRNLPRLFTEFYRNSTFFIWKSWFSNTWPCVRFLISFSTIEYDKYSRIPWLLRHWPPQMFE